MEDGLPRLSLADLNHLEALLRRELPKGSEAWPYLVHLFEGARMAKEEREHLRAWLYALQEKIDRALRGPTQAELDAESVRALDAEFGLYKPPR